jgi:hypothetical protein
MAADLPYWGKDARQYCELGRDKIVVEKSTLP